MIYETADGPYEDKIPDWYMLKLLWIIYQDLKEENK